MTRSEIKSVMAYYGTISFLASKYVFHITFHIFGFIAVTLPLAWNMYSANSHGLKEKYSAITKCIWEIIMLMLITGLQICYVWRIE